MRTFCLLVVAFARLPAAAAAGALVPSEVLILVNTDTPSSSQVANIYTEWRDVPAGNVLRLALGTSHEITRAQYRTRIVPAVKKRLQEDPSIRCLLTTSGFPYTIQATPGKQDGAAVDNELAGVLRDEPADLDRWQPNPMYLRGDNAYGNTDPRAAQMVYVARLDGPDFRTISHMVADAITTEKSGLEGPVSGDSRGLDGNADAAATDGSIRRAIDEMAGAGFRATLDMNEETWRPPAGGIGEQAAGAAFYVGWYSLQHFQDVFGRQGLARGAIAWHVASGEAAAPWDGKTTEWCPNLLRRGAAVTLGPAFEPYLSAFPKADIFVEQLLMGRSVAESYWLALPHISWAMVLLGDPLYRPFSQKPKAALVARGYIAATPGRVFEKGQSAPLLVRLECVGPAGSGTPALAATAEAGKGLSAASGNVSIPALQAGQEAVVRVPQVTAGSDPTGMFRLHLNVETPGETTRRIVVEGRTGFSLIDGGAGRESRMFVSPRGSFVISGLPGAAFLIETAGLQRKEIRFSSGWGLVGAAFSPDEARVVLTFLQPQQKRVQSILADTVLTAAVNLPAETQFLRWLSKGKLLLNSRAGLMEYDVGAGTSTPIPGSDGWETVSVMPGTDIVLLKGKAGGLAVRNGSEPPRQILAGTPLVRDVAVADDLSQFGGVDAQNRLWIEHGWDARPEVVAEGVAHVAWGPISRKVVVETANNQARLYDGRARSWLTLGLAMMGNWSPDETRFAYISGEPSEKQLVPHSLALAGANGIEDICSAYRIGDVASISLTANGDTVFLLAGPDADLQVWQVALPGQKP